MDMFRNPETRGAACEFELQSRRSREKSILWPGIHGLLTPPVTYFPNRRQTQAKEQQNVRRGMSTYSGTPYGGGVECVVCLIDGFAASHKHEFGRATPGRRHPDEMLAEVGKTG